MTVNELIKEYSENDLEADWKGLTPKERIALYFGQVLEFEIPKRQRTSINQNDNELPNDIYTN